MAIANIFQKLGTVQTAAIAGVLSLSSLLPFNATAQEPFKTSHHPGNAPNITEQYKPTIITQAGEYSEAHKVVGVFVYKGRKDESGLTGETIAQMITDYFTKRGIPAKAFVAPSPNDYSTVGYFVKGMLSKPYDLEGAVGGAVLASHDYAKAYGTTPEMLSAYGVKAASPTPHRE